MYISYIILVIVLSRFLTHACQNPYPLNRGTGIGRYGYRSEIFTRGLPVLFTRYLYIPKSDNEIINKMKVAPGEI
jgi:hypothetical protein